MLGLEEGVEAGSERGCSQDPWEAGLAGRSRAAGETGP